LECGAPYTVGLTIDDKEAVLTARVTTMATTTTSQARMVHAQAHTRNSPTHLSPSDIHGIMRWKYSDSLLRIGMSLCVDLVQGTRECEHTRSRRGEIVAELETALVQRNEEFGATYLPTQGGFTEALGRGRNEHKAGGERGIDGDEAERREREEYVNCLIEENKVRTAEKLEWRMRELEL
jgi:hypothetical protein